MDRLTRDQKEELFKKEVTQLFHVVDHDQYTEDYKRNKAERLLMGIIKIAQRDSLKCVEHIVQWGLGYYERMDLLGLFGDIIDELNLKDYVEVHIDNLNKRFVFDFNLPKEE